MKIPHLKNKQAIALLLLLITLPSFSVFASYKLQYYHISGTTHQELIAQMKSQSPTGDRGSTVSTKKLTVSKTSSPKGCYYSDIRFSQDIVINMPKWINKSKAPACLQRSYDRYWINLMQHEIKHREINRSLEGIVEKKLGTLGMMPTCKLLDEARIEIYQKLLASNRKKHDFFHRNGPPLHFGNCTASGLWMADCLLTHQKTYLSRKNDLTSSITVWGASSAR